jgi:hypothetical protein
MVATSEHERLLRVVAKPEDRALSRALDSFMIDREAMRCTATTPGLYRYTLGHFLASLRGRGESDPSGIDAGSTCRSCCITPVNG